MALKVISTVQASQTGAGAHASVAAGGDRYLVERGGSLSALGDGANGIHAAGGDLSATIVGSVSGQNWGIYAAGGLNNIEVANGGTVYGQDRGVYLTSNRYDYQFVRNSGTVSGGNEGVRVTADQIEIFNAGTISSQNGSAVVLDSEDGITRVYNTGSILGGGSIYLSGITSVGNGWDFVTNRGFINGGVSLGGGNDTFDNRGGTLTNGFIDLGTGTNKAWSGDGNDAFITGLGDDFIDAGGGEDVINLRYLDESLRLDLAFTGAQDTGAGIKTILNLEHIFAGSNGNHRLSGSDIGNSLATGAGNDTLEGRGGNDTLNASNGSDTALYSSEVGARVDLNKQGQAQNTNYGFDTLYSIENLTGGSGNDAFTGDTNANALTGNGGNDTLDGGLGDDTLDGGTGTNVAKFSGTAAESQVVDNGDGSFTVTGPDGIDLVRDVRVLQFADTSVALWNAAPAGLALSQAQVAEDALAGTIIATLRATDADGDALTYSLAATDGPFRIDGNNLVLTGAVDYETKSSYSLTVTAKDVFGLTASQVFTFDVANVVETNPLVLVGTANGDALTGEAGNDVLTGLARNDVLKGNAGNDKLSGGLGKDVLSGGTGQDVFVFETRPNKSTNIDTITDFSVADDTIHLAKSIFRTITKKGVLKADAFYAGAKAHDASDRIIYDAKKGALYYDADGTGATAQIQIATLSKNLKMTYRDFFVV